MANFLRLSFNGYRKVQNVVSKKAFFKKNNEGSEKVFNFSGIPQHICYF